MGEGLLASGSTYLLHVTHRTVTRKKKEQTLSPRPLPKASKVSLTCKTRSRVGSTTSARKRVTIRDDSIYGMRQTTSEWFHHTYFNDRQSVS